MRRLILQRLLLSIPLPFVVSGLTFLLTALTPGDLARSILGGNATQAQVDSLRHQLGLDEPLAVRYWQWLDAALHGNLGVSPTMSEPVTTVLDTRLGVTLSHLLRLWHPQHREPGRRRAVPFRANDASHASQ